MSKPSFLPQLGAMGSQVGRSQRFWLMAGGITLATLLMGVFVIQIPWAEQRRHLAQVVYEEEQRSQILLGIRRLWDDQKKHEQELLLEGGSTALAGEISRIATRNGLQVESVSPADALPMDPYVQYPVQIVAIASPRDLLNFLNQLEKHQPLLVVNQLEIGEPPSGSRMASLRTRQTEAFEPPDQQQRAKLIVSAFGRQKKEGR